MIQSRLSRVLGCLPLVGALAIFAGCNGQGATEATESAQAGVEQAAEAPAKSPERARGKHGMHGMHGRGPEHLLVASLRELTLSDAQRATIEGELDALRAERPEPKDRAEHEAHRATIAAAIRSGKIDEAAFQPPARKAPPPDSARMTKAIQTLHDTLTPEQRTQLVTAVSARMDEHEKGFGPKGEMRGPRGEMGGPLGHMLGDIEMSDAQREKVRAALAGLAPNEADRTAMKAKHEAFRQGMRERMATFAADRFDAAAFAAPPKDAPAFEGTGGPHAMMGKALAAVVPLLDEGQRAELARRFEQGPPAGMHHGAGEDCAGK